MIYERKIGNITVRNIIEYSGPTHKAPYLFAEPTPGQIEAHLDKITPTHFAPRSSCFVITIQMWAIFAGDDIILVDTGAGNHKTRPAPRMHMLNTLTLEWLAAAGITRENVTQVIFTHLHEDHVGWNTTLVDGKWEPTFPNATYHFPKRNHDIYRERYDAGQTGIRSGSFADCVLPIFDAGLAKFIDEDKDLFDFITPIDAEGHAPGMLNFSIKDGGEEGLFCTDVLHSPLQIYSPTLNTAFCEDPDLARKTRLKVLNKAADTGCLIMPTHFGEPYAGHITRDGDGFAFAPAPLVRA